MDTSIAHIFAISNTNREIVNNFSYLNRQDYILKQKAKQRQWIKKNFNIFTTNVKSTLVYSGEIWNTAPRYMHKINQYVYANVEMSVKFLLGRPIRARTQKTDVNRGICIDLLNSIYSCCFYLNVKSFPWLNFTNKI